MYSFIHRKQYYCFNIDQYYSELHIFLLYSGIWFLGSYFDCFDIEYLSMAVTSKMLLCASFFAFTLLWHASWELP